MKRASHDLQLGERGLRMLQKLEAAGLKLTPQRRAIVKQFSHDHSHPTAQELYERLRNDFPSMSFATVYNTLDALSGAGLSSSLQLGGAARFDPNVAPHHHAVCDKCGDIVDIPAESLKPASSTVARLHDVGFAVHSEERLYRGTCQRCASRNHS